MSEYIYTPKDGDKPDRISPPDGLSISKNDMSSGNSNYLEKRTNSGCNTPLYTMEMITSYYDKNAPLTFGNVLSGRVIGASQLFMPWNACNDDNETLKAHPLYYRSITDSFAATGSHWTPWRRIAYYDEIEAVVMSILRSKGLIT